MPEKIKKLMRNLLDGAGSVVDIYPKQDGKYSPTSFTQSRSDTEALRRDWERVGADLSQAIAHETKTKDD